MLFQKIISIPVPRTESVLVWIPTPPYYQSPFATSNCRKLDVGCWLFQTERLAKYNSSEKYDPFWKIITLNSMNISFM